MRNSLSYIFEDEEPVVEDDIVKLLRQYIRGTISGYKLEESDPFIKEVHEKYKKPESWVEFDVDTSDFMQKLDLDGDDAYFYQMINSPYNDFNFTDWYTTQDDFKEGYSNVYDYFNEENLETLKKIAKYILPAVPFDINNTDYKIKLNKILMSTFGGEVEDLLSEYHSYTENAFLESCRAHIKEDFDDNLKEYGITYDDYYNRILIYVSELIKLGRYFNYKGNLKGLYDLIMDELRKKIRGGWMQDYYNLYDDEYFDNESYNRMVSNNLENILEYIEDDNPNFQEFFKFVNKITKKFKVEEWIPLPKDERFKFKIEDFNIDDMTITVSIGQGWGYGNKKRKLSEEDFYNLLYHPELFDLEY